MFILHLPVSLIPLPEEGPTVFSAFPLEMVRQAGEACEELFFLVVSKELGRVHGRQEVSCSMFTSKPLIILGPMLEGLEGLPREALEDHWTL